VLSPDVIVVADDLAEAYSTIKKVDAFAYASMNTLIGKLSPDPDWIGPIRKELELLNIAGAQWQQKKPDIWSPILSQFTNYSTLFSGVADLTRQLGNDKDSWLELLHQLSNSLATGENASKAAEGQFTLQINNLNDIQQVFDSSLGKAWAALADEEQGMIDLATQVTALQDKVNRLEDDLTSAGISSGKSYIQSSVSITYTLISSAGVSIPYLTIAALLFTIGKEAYDLIVTDKEIAQTINKIVELRNKLSQEAQAAAMSKAIVQLIDNFDKSLASVNRQLPALSTMWANEKAKVDQAISAIHAGAVPRQMIELVSMPSAAASWATLVDFIFKLNQQIAQGESVNLTTSESSSAA
jgi:hypothetical protein